MSIIYFLAPYERQKWLEAHEFQSSDILSDLEIDPIDYSKALSERWPSVQFIHNDANFALTWELPENRQGFVGIRGNLYSNLQVVSFSRAFQESFVNFVLWHRRFVPPRYRLCLFDTGSPQSLEITLDARDDVLSRFVGY